MPLFAPPPPSGLLSKRHKLAEPGSQAACLPWTLTSIAAAPRWFLLLKLFILALLTIDAVIYALLDRPSAALDSMAWLVLLLLFQAETEFPDSPALRRLAPAIHVARVAAILGLGWAGLAFLQEQEWLDVVNAALWMGVVVLFECEVRFTRLVARWKRAFLAVGGTLLAALTGLVLVWAWQGKWFDAFDAGLWIIAFATLEVDLLNYFRPAPEASKELECGYSLHRRQ